MKETHKKVNQVKTVKKIYGPYTRNDGRAHVVVVYTDLSKRTISYPKYLVEQRLGRELDPKLETIDHIDGNLSNNELSNLQVISLREHTMLDKKRHESKLLIGACVWCKKQVTYNVIERLANAKRGIAGPFCSRSCSGKYGAAVQNNVAEKADIEIPTPKYTTRKKELMKNGKTRISDVTVTLTEF